MEPIRPNASVGQRWSAARPTKTLLVWSCVASVVMTMIIGFTWGGWVTGSTARTMAAAAGESAIVQRLAPICVAQFQEQPDKAQRLKELNEIASWQRTAYVERQGWATMLGEETPDNQVAIECARLLTPTSQ